MSKTKKDLKIQELEYEVNVLKTQMKTVESWINGFINFEQETRFKLVESIFVNSIKIQRIADAHPEIEIKKDSEIREYYKTITENI